ncbi:MAG: nitroreductase family deazaflavin-dependent oxidoreductase [Chloroflexi bacterium]|nr:nitroreductase family deazaflavin-dependent oxidoreductase [Chloroflexota bacterium]
MTSPASSARPFARIEAEFFRALNACVEPVVRAGAGSPGLVPVGMVVVETVGARTGTPRPVPLVATLLEGCLIVSTVRGRQSRWMRNLKAHPRVRYWIAGEEHAGIAHVFEGHEIPASAEALPPLTRTVATRMLGPGTAWGWTFAVIQPDAPD